MPINQVDNESPGGYRDIKQALNSQNRDKWSAEFTAESDGRHRVPSRTGFVIGNLPGRQDTQWLLLPYVPRIDQNVRRKFVAELQTRFPIDVASADYQTLITELLKFENRERLKKLYDVIDTNHNHVSMCLYSGPYRFGRMHPRHLYLDYEVDSRRSIHSTSLVRHHSILVRDTDGILHRETACGWLGTGDQNLKKGRKPRTRYVDMINYYQGLLQNVVTMMVPHHGSSNNSDDYLYSRIHPSIAYVTVNENDGVHPSKMISDIALSAVGGLLKVTSDVQTELRERIEIY